MNSREKTYYTVPHSNSSYTDSATNSFGRPEKQLAGSYNVIDESSELGATSRRRVTKQRSLSPRHTSGATNGRIYFEPDDEASSIGAKKRGSGQQADNAMEEIQLDDLYIYDHGDGAGHGGRQQSPDKDSSTYSVSCRLQHLELADSCSDEILTL